MAKRNPTQSRDAVASVGTYLRDKLGKDEYTRLLGRMYGPARREEKRRKREHDRRK